AKYPEYAALRGDPSDNLPGVPGVGEKTAAKLINEYGDLDGVFAHLDELTPKLRENLAAHAEQVRSNAKCTPLVRDLPLDVDTDQLRMAPWDPEQVRKLFNFLEFRTLYDRLIEAVGAPAGSRPHRGRRWLARTRPGGGRVPRRPRGVAIRARGAGGAVRGRRAALTRCAALRPARPRRGRRRPGGGRRPAGGGDRPPGARARRGARSPAPSRPLRRRRAPAGARAGADGEGGRARRRRVPARAGARA